MSAAEKKRRVRRLARSLRRYHAAVALLLALVRQS
jgi:hypothetical protein